MASPARGRRHGADAVTEMADACLLYMEHAFWTGAVVGSTFMLLALVPISLVAYRRGWLSALRDLLE